MQKSQITKPILILTKLYDQQINHILLTLIDYLRQYHIISYYFTDQKNYQNVAAKFPKLNIFLFNRLQHEKIIQYVVTIGGDGTILYAAGLFQNRSTPKIIPFEKGTLGFLCKFKLTDMQYITTKLIMDMNGLKSSFKMESKMRIMCKKTNSNKPFYYSCLNELAITKEVSQTQIKIEIYIADKLLTITSGDGILISTPTGSTAYSLSVGGPIIHNQIKTILIVAISPNSLSFRPISLPSSVRLKIKINEKSRIDGFVSCDGQFSDAFMKGEQIQIYQSPYDVKVLAQQDYNQIDLWSSKLKQLLNWNNQYTYESAEKLSLSKL